MAASESGIMPTAKMIAGSHVVGAVASSIRLATFVHFTAWHVRRYLWSRLAVNFLSMQ